MQSGKKKKIISLRIFAILCSFLLWLYVLSSAQITVDKIVKIHYLLPKDQSLLSDSPKEILYTLKGPRAIVRNLFNKDSFIEVNLKEIYKKGKKDYEIPVNALGMNFPFGIEILATKPNKLDLELDEKLEKLVSVDLQSVGAIPKNYVMTQYHLFPSSVILSGPRKLIEKYNEVKTLPANLDIITQSGSKEILLSVLDERIAYSQNNVIFQYEVQPTRANLMIKNVPIKFLTSRNFERVNSRTVNLMVLAENDIEAKKNKKKVKVIAEIPDDGEGEVNIELKASLPEGLQLLEIIPDKIKVFLKDRNKL